MHGERSDGRAAKVRPRIRRAVAVAGAAAALSLAAGCGGGGDDDSGGAAGGGTTAPQTTGTGASAGDTGGASADTGSGRQLFIDTCGGCHQLEDAGTSGGIGPDLNELQPDAERVLNAIQTGPGAMPAGLLDGEEAQQVADYVATSTGGA